MMGKRVDAMDRISELPDFIIHHIMSYLEPKQVAQTSVLSKKWNHFRMSFPILSFSQADFREKEDFIKYVDITLLRFHNLNFSLCKFFLLTLPDDCDGLSSHVDKWIGLAVENEVKELYLNLLTDGYPWYTLPQTIFSAKSVTSLALCGCRLEQPSDGIRFHSLKSLTLEMVHLEEELLKKLSSECPELEDLIIYDCQDFNSVYVSNVCKLKFLKVDDYLDNIRHIEIAAPSLQVLKLALFGEGSRHFVLDMAQCPNLRDLTLSGNFFTDQNLHHVISKFPLLKSFELEQCHSFKRVRISSHRLKI